MKGISSDVNDLKIREDEYGHNRKTARESESFIEF